MGKGFAHNNVTRRKGYPDYWAPWYDEQPELASGTPGQTPQTTYAVFYGVIEVRKKSAFW
jgi:hypothetical protein